MHSVIVAPEAYTKGLLHSFKYPSHPAMGVLIGKVCPCVVTDAVALCHSVVLGSSRHTLVAAFLHLVGSHCLSRGLVVVGLYYTFPSLPPGGPNLVPMPVYWFYSALAQHCTKQYGTEKLILWQVDHAIIHQIETNGGSTIPPENPLTLGVVSLTHISAPKVANTESDVKMVSLELCENTVEFGHILLNPCNPTLIYTVKQVIAWLSEEYIAYNTSINKLVDFEDHCNNPGNPNSSFFNEFIKFNEVN